MIVTYNVLRFLLRISWANIYERYLRRAYDLPDLKNTLWLIRDKPCVLRKMFCKSDTHTCMHAHTHTHLFNGPLSVTTQVSRYQKGKTNLDFTGARDSGISWAICKSAPRSRQIATQAPHYSGFFTCRMPFLPPNQQCQSTEGTQSTKGKSDVFRNSIVTFALS